MALADVNVIRGSAATQTTHATFIKELWENEIKRELDANLMMTRYATRVPDIFKQGNKIHIPTVGRLAVYGKAKETPVSLQAYTEGEFTMLVKRHMETSFMVEDILKVQQSYDTMREYTREGAYALALDVDNWLLGYRAALKAQGQNITVGGILDSPSILAAKLLLDKARVPRQGRVWIVSPAQYISLLGIEAFISADYVNERPVSTGIVGTLYGDPVEVNNNLVKNTANGYINGREAGTCTPGFFKDGVYSPYWPEAAFNGDVNGAGQETIGSGNTLIENAYSALYCHPEWLRFWMPVSPSVEMGREPTYISDLLVSHQFYDAKIYRPEFAVTVESTEAG